MTDFLILYVGEAEAGQALQEVAARAGSYVYLPEHLMQALGMYITYFPHIVVIDMAVDYAAAAYEHLLSVDARPLILLTGEYVRSTTIRTLPRAIDADSLFAAIQRFGQPLPDNVLRFA